MDSTPGGALMRLSDLRDARVKNLNGKTLGRVHEVHAEGGRIVALTYGAPGLVERLTAKTHGHRIAWERVVKVTRHGIVVSPEGRASRSRKGTRQPSALQSKR